MSVFNITNKDLEKFSDSGAVDLVRNMVWAEATVTGIKRSSINIPMNPYAPDGGVDGEIIGAKITDKNDIIKAGNTSYQIKSGKFSLTEPEIDKILFKDNDRNELKPRIKHCFDNDGTFVVIFTSWDNPDKHGPVEERFLDRLKHKKPEYKKPNIEVWGQNKIVGFLERFPALQLEVLQISGGPFYRHSEWSGLGDMKPAIHLGEEQTEWIDNLQNMLRKNDDPLHIRITGEPGIGKTRLVLEATRSSDLSPLTIYVDDPTKLDDNDFNRIWRRDNAFIILVVDDCDFNKQADLWNLLESKSPRIKLITIFNEPDSSSGTTYYLEPPPLKDEQIGKILEEYYVPQQHRQTWIEYCRPSPRAAHIVGQNLRQNPDDVLKSPDNVPVWDRYIAGRNNLKSEEFKKRKIVLLWLSQFTKFGFKPPFDAEVKIIAKKVEDNHDIRYRDFIEIINKLKDMKILQGHTTLYITPKILHLKLWAEWWERYGESP